MEKSENNKIIINDEDTQNLVEYLNKREDLYYTLKYLTNITKDECSEISFSGYRIKIEDDDDETFNFIKDMIVNHYQKQFDKINEQILEFGIIIE